MRIVDDLVRRADGSVRLGRLAAHVRDRRVPLELCPTSNVHTGAVASFAEHPLRLLAELRFRVTVNTDNRLMSDVTLSGELLRCVEELGWDAAALRWVTVNAAKSAFAPFDERLRLIEEVVKPGFAAVFGELEPSRPR